MKSEGDESPVADIRRMVIRKKIFFSSSIYLPVNDKISFFFVAE
jgi:hypothetical protein